MQSKIFAYLRHGGLLSCCFVRFVFVWLSESARSQPTKQTNKQRPWIRTKQAKMQMAENQRRSRSRDQMIERTRSRESEPVRSQREGSCGDLEGWVNKHWNRICYLLSIGMIVVTVRAIGRTNHDQGLSKFGGSTSQADAQLFLGIRAQTETLDFLAKGKSNTFQHATESALQLAPPAATQRPLNSTALCDITHVFSPFVGASEKALGEYEAAERSWVIAATKAGTPTTTFRGRHAAHTDVHFVGATLPADRSAVPYFARYVKLDDNIANGNGIILPTVNTILRAGQKAAKLGGYVIFTNWDIGVVPGFYTEICQRIQHNPSSWLALDITRLDVDVSGLAPTGVNGGYELSAFLSGENQIRIKQHPGHDCFLIPQHLDLSCFNNMGVFVLRFVRIFHLIVMRCLNNVFIPQPLEF
jgi:hypothetical protein